MLWSEVPGAKELSTWSLFEGSGRDSPSCFVLLASLTSPASRIWLCSEMVRDKRVARRLNSARDIVTVGGRGKCFDS